MKNDFYTLLNISRNATRQEIHSAYKKLAFKYHPDKAKANNLTIQEATELFKKINEAHQTLINPDARALYDKKLNNEIDNQNQIRQRFKDLIIKSYLNGNLFLHLEDIFANFIDQQLTELMADNLFIILDVLLDLALNTKEKERLIKIVLSCLIKIGSISHFDHFCKSGNVDYKEINITILNGLREGAYEIFLHYCQSTNFYYQINIDVVTKGLFDLAKADQGQSINMIFNKLRDQLGQEAIIDVFMYSALNGKNKVFEHYLDSSTTEDTNKLKDLMTNALLQIILGLLKDANLITPELKNEVFSLSNHHDGFYFFYYIFTELPHVHDLHFETLRNEMKTKLLRYFLKVLQNTENRSFTEFKKVIMNALVQEANNLIYIDHLGLLNDETFEWIKTHHSKIKEYTDLVYQLRDLINNQTKVIIFELAPHCSPLDTAWTLIQLNNASLLEFAYRNHDIVVSIANLKLKELPQMMDLMCFMIKQIIHLESTKNETTFIFMTSKKLEEKISEYKDKIHELSGLSSMEEFEPFKASLVNDHKLTQACNFTGFSFFESQDIKQLKKYVNDHKRPSIL